MTQPSGSPKPPERFPGSGASRSAAPQRPALSVPVPSPLEDLIGPPPAAVARAFALWMASFVLGALVTGYVITKRDELLRSIELAVRRDDPTITAESLDEVVRVSLYAALGGVLLVMLVEVTLALAMRRRSNWARALLAVLGVASLPGFFAAQDLLSTGAPLWRNYVQLGLGLQGLLVLAAVVAMFLPSANAWFRLHHRARY